MSDLALISPAYPRLGKYSKDFATLSNTALTNDCFGKDISQFLGSEYGGIDEIIVRISVVGLSVTFDHIVMILSVLEITDLYKN